MPLVDRKAALKELATEWRRLGAQLEVPDDVVRDSLILLALLRGWNGERLRVSTKNALRMDDSKYFRVLADAGRKLLAVLSSEEADSVRQAVEQGDLYCGASPESVAAATRRWSIPNAGAWLVFSESRMADVPGSEGGGCREPGESLRLVATARDGNSIGHGLVALVGAITESELEEAIHRSPHAGLGGAPLLEAIIVAVCHRFHRASALCALIRHWAAGPESDPGTWSPRAFSPLVVAIVVYATIKGVEEALAIMRELSLVDSMKPLHEMLRLSLSDGRSGLLRLAPEMQEPVTELWKLWNMIQKRGEKYPAPE